MKNLGQLIFIKELDLGALMTLFLWTLGSPVSRFDTASDTAAAAAAAAAAAPVLLPLLLLSLVLLLKLLLLLRL